MIRFQYYEIPIKHSNKAGSADEDEPTVLWFGKMIAEQKRSSSFSADTLSGFIPEMVYRRIYWHLCEQLLCS